MAGTAAAPIGASAGASARADCTTPARRPSASSSRLANPSAARPAAANRVTKLETSAVTRTSSLRTATTSPRFLAQGADDHAEAVTGRVHTTRGRLAFVVFLEVTLDRVDRGAGQA